MFPSTLLDSKTFFWSLSFFAQLLIVDLNILLKVRFANRELLGSPFRQRESVLSDQESSAFVYKSSWIGLLFSILRKSRSTLQKSPPIPSPSLSHFILPFERIFWDFLIDEWVRFDFLFEDALDISIFLFSVRQLGILIVITNPFNRIGRNCLQHLLYFNAHATRPSWLKVPKAPVLLFSCNADLFTNSYHLLFSLSPTSMYSSSYFGPGCVVSSEIRYG